MPKIALPNASTLTLVSLALLKWVRIGTDKKEAFRVLNAFLLSSLMSMPTLSSLL
jgi:hypothetical protein